MCVRKGYDTGQIKEKATGHGELLLWRRRGRETTIQLGHPKLGRDWSASILVPVNLYDILMLYNVSTKQPCFTLMSDFHCYYCKLWLRWHICTDSELINEINDLTEIVL